MSYITVISNIYFLCMIQNIIYTMTYTHTYLSYTLCTVCNISIFMLSFVYILIVFLCRLNVFFISTYIHLLLKIQKL